MLARTSERKMLVVRSALLLGWGILIGSLFWDPVTVKLTAVDNLASPFRAAELAVPVQEGALHNAPYAMGARIFWTMVVPILPLFLMVFGHEAWRRICPLSLASQIPRYLGLRRQRAIVQRRTGKVERVLALIGRNDWLARNAWYVQFGLLFTGLCARILFINSDRIALAVGLIGVILAAVTVGWLWGGKSWCNYICPINVVQKIYTEPRGLLESAAHLSGNPISQAMCRSSTAAGERSACVGCMTNCGDIDLERSYWDTILEPARRHVYYMFFGLIIGFYGYYYLYSGDWTYYFSGIWTHEADALDKLFDPGLFLMGRQIPIPKLAAVPLVLGLSVLSSLLLGLVLERLYRLIRRRRGAVPEAEIVNHCLSVSAYISINTFYLFGGRPNLLLLPPPVMHLVDIVIVSLTTMWLWQALHRTPFKYRREGMARTLLDQLRKLKIDFSRHLEGRRLEDLKPDEIYVLTKVMPASAREQKLQAYKNILDDAIRTGKTASATSLELLHDIRMRMDISDEEHTNLLEGMGAAEIIDLDVGKATSAERAAGMASYRQLVGGNLIPQIVAGRSVEAILADPAMRETMQVLRASFQITDAEQAQVIAEITSPDILGEPMRATLDRLRDLQALRFRLMSSPADEPLGQTLFTLLDEIVAERIGEQCAKGLSILRALRDAPASWFAQDLSALGGLELAAMLARPAGGRGTSTWADMLEPHLLPVLEGAAEDPAAGERPADLPRRAYREVIGAGLDAEACLDLMLVDEDPLARALALTAFSFSDPALAEQRAAGLLLERHQHWLLEDVLVQITGTSQAEGPARNEQGLQITLEEGGGARRHLVFNQAYVTIGRATGNDIVIQHPAIWPYHMAVGWDRGEVKLIRLDDVSLCVDGTEHQDESVVIAPGAIVTFGELQADMPCLSIGWDMPTESQSLQSYDAMTLVLMLARNPDLRREGLSALAERARSGSVGRHLQGTRLRPLEEAGRRLFLVHVGRLCLTDTSSDRRRVLEAGDFVELGPDDQFAWLEVESEFAIVATAGCPERVAPAAPSARAARPRDERTFTGSLPLPAV